MLSSKPGRQGRIRSANAKTSSRRICRSSGLGCTVMPSAPASCARRAKRSKSGTPVRREFRNSATLLRFTLNRGMGVAFAKKPLDIARDLIDLYVHAGAGAQRAEGRHRLSVGDEVDTEPVALHFVDREAHAIDRDRPLARDVAGQGGGD